MGSPRALCDLVEDQGPVDVRLEVPASLRLGVCPASQNLVQFDSGSVKRVLLEDLADLALQLGAVELANQFS